MGLIRAVVNSASGVLKDQWKEFFYCDALPSDVMVVRGQKKTSKGSQNRGNDNVISNGSGISVADGQCMIIVDQGRVVEICAEPGEYRYDTSSEPSIFAGNLGDSIHQSFKTLGRRISYGGDTARDQRVYYFNTKEMLGCKFGTPNPVPFRVVDANIGLDIDISIRCNGTYSYRITDPLLFYTNVCGNVQTAYRRTDIDKQLKSEFLTALQPGYARISALGVRYSALPGHTKELCQAMNDELSDRWANSRGIAIVSVAINSITAPKEDEDMIKTAQKSAILQNKSMAAATIVGAQADAMRSAAQNKNGAMMGFMGMNMASSAGGVNANTLFNQADQEKQAKVDTWRCGCGFDNVGKFCIECGKPKPEVKPQSEGWTCECGTVNLGKFCHECGTKKPLDAPLYRCDKCGWRPVDPTKPPKFCPECGDPFNELDIENPEG